MPKEAKFISGETSFKQVLASDGGSKTITYILQMHKEGEIRLPACKASFLDLDEYSEEVTSDTPVVYVGVPISLNGSNTHPGGTTRSNQEKNESSFQDQSEEDSPGFGPVLSIAGFLAVTPLLRRRKP